jgi:kynurenine formamidase
MVFSKTPSYDKGNWGRWGENDERGTLNLITPDVVKYATSLVRRGQTFSLCLPITNAGVGVPSFPTRAPPLHVASYRKTPDGAGTGDDYLITNTHNQTHLDSIAHEWLDNTIYNGYSDDVISSQGATRCGIDKVGGIVTRGVLLDIARFKGVKCLEKGEGIFSQDLESCAKSQNVPLREGDAVLVRTGSLNSFDLKNPAEFFTGAPGLAQDSVAFFDKYGTAVVGTDTCFFEVQPVQDRPWDWPVHVDLIWKRGMFLIELLNLEKFAEQRIYEFLFVVAPLKIDKGLGSPINPLAIV